MVDVLKWATGSAEDNTCKMENNNVMTTICFKSLRIYQERQRVSKNFAIFPISWWRQGKGEILVLPLKIRG